MTKKLDGATAAPRAQRSQTEGNYYSYVHSIAVAAERKPASPFTVGPSMTQLRGRWPVLHGRTIHTVGLGA
ncbi:hypothetical protein CSOJ01_09552 [Colletotrichum sojae]|uniref:Uncharacterized protein n=1 Tax=Colletotrichum sojae TaxID=2175907 RepID=A0A8H6MRB0_9PEZI|nr:hypothetical protein CSOJ01_09552 [Colletotrichum sojae]